jgi:putative aldouronate transport system permease protein
MRQKSIIVEKWNAFDILNMFFIGLFALLCIYPFYYMLIYSLSNPELSSRSITLLPKGFTFENYAKVFTLPNFNTAIFVSVGRTIAGTVITVACCSFFAYLVTKKNMYFRKTIYRILVVTMYISGGLIPTYLVMNAYGLVNNYLIYIIPSALSAYNVILIKTFIEQLPDSLEESALLDGAEYFQCWWHIIIPLSKPILATIAVFSAVSQWNAWFDAHIYITKTNMWPLQYILYRYLKQVQTLTTQLEDSFSDSQVYRITPEAVRMTITAVVTIPILFIYPFMQRYFMKGLLIGAIKG